MNGKLIVLYGVNNIGKSTQQRRLAEALQQRGHEAVLRKSPNYDSQSGKLINGFLREGKPVGSKTELQLWMAINMHQDKGPIQELCSQGKSVVLEDYWGTTIAWGVAQDVPRELLDIMVSGLPAPDVSILLHGKRFLKAREAGHIHESNPERANRVSKELLALADEFGWHKIDANQSVDEVYRAIMTVAEKELGL